MGGGSLEENEEEVERVDRAASEKPEVREKSPGTLSLPSPQKVLRDLHFGELLGGNSFVWLLLLGVLHCTSVAFVQSGGHSKTWVLKRQEVVKL